MAPLLVALLIVAGFAAYLAVVWLSTDSREIRFWAACAVAGSVVLCLATTFTTLCGIAENRSELFNERCEGSVPYIPLYAIPPLLAAPFLRRFLPGAAVFMVGALLIVVAIVVPKQLLSV